MLRFTVFSFFHPKLYFIQNFVVGILLFDFFISFIEVYAKIYSFSFFITNYIFLKIL